MPDIAYGITRRRGKPATVVITSGDGANPETGERSLQVVTHNIRLVVKEPTSYGRFIKARASQQDVGDTTFIFWIRDILFKRLKVEDYVIMEGKKYEVVTSVQEETAFIVTAQEIVGTVGKQEVSLNANNSLSVEQTNTPIIT